ncbi:NAD(P)-dependent oxidoreductase [Micromonospora sp. ATA51]|uniref:NAD(P)-dependent oxidoreductase n=1 Tax=Micromonospora sp. ATA51 TaxID=2806098 RepID=UPI0035CB8A8F
MKLTIVGATGGIGRHLVDQAAAAGDDVTAVVRDPAKLGDVPVRVVAADLATADPATLRAAFTGTDAVLSGLGPRSSADAGIATRGTRAVVEARTAVAYAGSSWSARRRSEWCRRPAGPDRRGATRATAP